MRSRSLGAFFVAGLASVTFLAALLSVDAMAKVPIYSAETITTSQQAGAHADVALRVEFGNQFTEPPAIPCFCNSIRDLKVNTPAGLLAAPRNIAQCNAADFSELRCPVDSQMGIALIRLVGDVSTGGAYTFAPLYNMEARNDQLALLAFPAPFALTPVYIDVTSRTESDYGLEFKTFGIPSLFPPNEVTQINWGVPADPRHDDLRFPFTATKFSFCGNLSGNNPLPDLLDGVFPADKCDAAFAPNPAGTSPIPFVSNPTKCGGPSPVSIETFAYDLEIDRAEISYSAITGCDKLSFDPTLSAQPTTGEADSPSGLGVALEVPQPVSDTTPTPSAIRETTVTLPEGFTINPNAADGKTGCTDEQANFGTRDAAQCPEFSKIGTLGVTSTQLPGVLPGAMYLGEPLPGNRYRVFLVADGFSLHVKQPGTATPVPETGQLSVTFKDLPQFSFQLFDLHFFGAERGLLATPEQCGTYAVETEFVPWAAPHIPNQTSTQFFEIDSGPGGGPCPSSPRSFSPELNAGVTDNTGGESTDFVFDLQREDGDQNLDEITVNNPPGFSAILAGVPYCSEAELAAAASDGASGLDELSSPSCPASQIGTSSASAGAGSRPIHLDGRVYLAGPYKGAPLSLAVITPAVSGPYDLGNVVVRVAVHVDPNTAEITAKADPLPQIIEGIPLRIRRVLVELNRDNFVINPTNCSPFEVGAEVSGDEGGNASLADHFQVANCGAMGFAPRLGIRLRGSAKRNAHPSLQAVLRPNAGDANIRRAAVTLPRTTLLDQGNLVNICTREQFASDNCPARSIYGRAVAVSPLLDKALRGPVILRANGGARRLPDLVADLRGQIDFELVGFVDSVRGGLRTIFQTVPDVPVTKFVVRLQGGARKGLIANSTNLCRNPARFRSVMHAQNGRRQVTRPRLRVNCGRARKGKRKGRRAGVSLARKVVGR